MMAPPPVVGVSRAMPDSIQGISHVPELISSYLLPHTIDAAVYNGLHRVIQVYGASRPLTDAAMDGAATRGRLSIVQWLSSGRRRSGCSEAAFTGAASNGHLRVLKWLIQYSPKEYHFTQCLTAAAGAGQLAVVQFQRSQRRIYDKIPPFIAAAANGHVDVLKALGPWPFDIYRAVNAAVANGQVSVLVLGMYCAAQNGRTDLVNLLMSTCEFDSGSIMRAVTDGAENDHCAVVKLLMDHFTLGKPNVSTDIVPMMQGVISIACRSAAERGNAEMVKILAVKCSSELIGLVLKETTKPGNHELVKLLLHECEARNLEDSWYHLRIGMMVQNAVSRGDVEMAKLLVEKCDPTDVGRSLKIAVENNSADMLHLLAPMTGVYIKEDPYIVAAL
ncbi:hypothetical protein PPTG_05844 [Phytophthora nicotianae INRA-310]|uniref:Uncharacterized protein n=1 Tax=Phytophthora nicotianae (strain INRA-310) TaxID=761204 RepID=W2QWN0_PHYN3|nr:hypothetical protein PPTG_05844 [Phytophthora nicotianae INRA-310]ETN16690.1 hypothetical protein PPTG_05844 [Phytophthora nicotianae INRA-310]